jgi:hypothetical protein
MAAASPPEDERRGRCWLCDEPLLEGERAASMLGKGIFLVHGACMERELGVRRRPRCAGDT